MYNTNFDLYDDLGNIKQAARKAACFASFYNAIKHKNYNYKKVIVFMTRKLGNTYSRIPNGFKNFTIEEITEYVRLLKLIGFKFNFSYDDTNFIFEIYFNENSTVATKALLNFIRNLEEDHGPIIVREFLRLSKQKYIGVSTFQKLQLAHTCVTLSNYNHSIFNGSVYQLLITNAQLKKLILDNESNNTVISVMPHCKTHKIHTEKEFIEYKNSFPNSTLYQILIKYKALCAKSM